MASVSLGAISFLPPSSLHSGSSAQSQTSQHHQLVNVNNSSSNSNITVSFSNHAMPQGMNILDEEDSGESKLEIIEEAQEEASPKETEIPSTSITSLRTIDVKKNRASIEESKFNNGNRMRSCLMDDNMSSKEAVESLLLLGQEAVVANDSQTGVNKMINSTFSFDCVFISINEPHTLVNRKSISFRYVNVQLQCHKCHTGDLPLTVHHLPKMEVIGLVEALVSTVNKIR